VIDNQNPANLDPASARKQLQPTDDTSLICLWNWDLHTNQVWRSERFRQVFSEPPSEGPLSVDAWHNRIHPEDKDEVISRLLKVVEQGGEWAAEYRFMRVDGSYTRVYDQGFPILSTGKVAGMTGYMMEVLKEKVHQPQAMSTEDIDLTLALEAAEIGTWVLDLATECVKCNDHCQKLLGIRNPTITPTDLSGRIHAADLNQLKKEGQRILQDRDSNRFEYEVRILETDGHSIRWLRLRGKAFFNSIGTPTRFAGTVLDVTNEHRKNQSIQQVDQHLPEAFNNAVVGIVITGSDGHYIHSNQAFSQITGYTAKELENTLLSQLIYPDDLERYQEQLNDLIAEVSASLTTQVRCVHKAGHILWLDVNTTVINDESGNKKTLFLIVQDITQDIAMRDAQQEMLTLVDHSQSFMGIADLTGRVTYLNKAARLLVGTDETDILAGIMVADFYSPEHYALIRDVAVPTLLREGHWSGRVSIKHFRTGEIIPCHASGIRIDDPVTGKPIARGFTMRDLRSELAAQDAQRKLLALVDNSVELMSVLEMDGRNSYINKAGMAMLGFENEQQVQETPIAELHAPEHFELVQQQVLPSVMTTGRWSGEMLVRHLQTGEIFPVFNNTIRIDDPHTGQPIAVGAVMRDMRSEVAAQQALIESEFRFRNMIMQAPVAIGLLRGEYLVVESANESMLSLWGKTADIIDKPLLVALPEIEGQGFVELLEGVYQTGQPHYGYEVLARLRRNGQLEDAYFNFVYAPVRQNNGVINGIIVVATEVTSQVVAKKELEESEKRFRNLILDAPVATAVYSGPDMVIQLANEAMLKLWGKDASVIGQKLCDALPELTGQPFHKLLDKVYTTGVAYQGIEDPADLLIDGKLQTYYFNFTYKPLRDAAGQVYAILNMALDITYQVTAKQQLKDVQESLREAIDLAELAPWTINFLTGEMVCSERVNDWLGVPGQITPEIVTRCIHEKDRQQMDQRIQAAIDPASGGKVDLEYTVINQQTQEERILRTQAQVLFTERDVPYLIRGTSQDITAHRMTEQALEKQVQLRTEELIKSNLQLKRSNQELERYAYVASHDLQEPLRKIQLYSSLIRERWLDGISADGRNHLHKVEESANRMSVLIKNILDFSRINHESGFATDVNLNVIVEGVIKDFDLLLSQKNGQVNADSLCVIPAIPLQMTQLFYNLIGNSLKFTREGVPPVITITCQQLTEQELKRHEKLNPRIRHCLITLSDNGIGFNPMFGEKIFGLFQRLHHQQQYEGTGIGLSLCQRIVFNHQGEMWAEGEEGKGATFYIILPMER
jgi:PAS domain S-box-containing protein